MWFLHYNLINDNVKGAVADLVCLHVSASQYDECFYIDRDHQISNHGTGIDTKFLHDLKSEMIPEIKWRGLDACEYNGKIISMTDQKFDNVDFPEHKATHGF